MIYGYCVTLNWLKDYDEKLGNDKPLSERGGMHLAYELNVLMSTTSPHTYSTSDDQWADVPSSQIYDRLRKTSGGEYLSQTAWDNMEEGNDPRWSGRKQYTSGLVFGICDNSDYDKVRTCFLESDHSVTLKKIFCTHDDPRWYWRYSNPSNFKRMQAITQPWTRQPGSQVVKLKPFEIVKDPRVRLG